MKRSLPETTMNDIAIYGAGGFGREVALMIRQINEHKPEWNLLGFFDDGKKKGDVVDGLPILGGIRDLNAKSSAIQIVMGIADPAIRKRIVAELDSKIDFPVIIHPSVLAGDLTINTFGRGTIICAGCILTTAVHIGEFVILNLATTIGHDVEIGAYCSVMPGCNISGFVKIEDNVYLGTGSIILPHLILGEHAVVGAGAVVTRSVTEGLTVVGVPASKM